MANIGNPVGIPVKIAEPVKMVPVLAPPVKERELVPA